MSTEKSMWDLELNETRTIDRHLMIRKVPGGWLYTTFHPANYGSGVSEIIASETFVPYSDDLKLADTPAAEAYRSSRYRIMEIYGPCDINCDEVKRIIAEKIPVAAFDGDQIVGDIINGLGSFLFTVEIDTKPIFDSYYRVVFQSESGSFKMFGSSYRYIATIKETK